MREGALPEWAETLFRGSVRMRIAPGPKDTAAPGSDEQFMDEIL
jgi:hypothetical protein